MKLTPQERDALRQRCLNDTDVNLDRLIVLTEHTMAKKFEEEKCPAIAPFYFQLVGKKATLKNSDKISKGAFAVDIDCDSDAEGSIISAGKSCPVNAIRVIDSE